MTRTLPIIFKRIAISSPALWGKLPSHGDFVRYNIPYNCDAEVKEWIQQEFTPIKEAHNPQNPAAMGHHGMPWCFVLPPGHFSFAQEDYVIGVWLNSSDKLGRQYPLVMIQTASPQWVKLYFTGHMQIPCNWLFMAARIMAKAVYIDQPNNMVSAQDTLLALTKKMDTVWDLVKMHCKKRHFGKQISLSYAQVAPIIGKPHPYDFAHHLHGVRHLPWIHWPEHILSDVPRPVFWQQDLSGRFVAAAPSMHHHTSLEK